jgi:hypothetical protein
LYIRDAAVRTALLGRRPMTKIVTAHSTSLDGCIAGADDRPEQPLGVGGDPLFT